MNTDNKTNKDNGSKARKKTGWDRLQSRLFDMVSVGVIDDPLNQSYDIISTLFLIINLVASFAMTFEDFYRAHYNLIYWTDAITVFFFAVDYTLRILTARKLYPKLSRNKAIIKYILSGYGIIDLLSFLPYYLPVFFPAGTVVFRMFRVVRIFRLFRINAYYDSLTVIGNVINAKKTQILASVFIIILLILASSLGMYSIEHEAQPEIFENALSGIWWATSTLFTVGYGDIYPITIMGQFLGIVITFLGVGLVAIPTGIISAGFVEEYQRVRKISDIEEQADIHFIEASLTERDAWVGKEVREIGMPRHTLVAAIVRGKRILIPRGNTTLAAGDRIIITAESAKGDIFSHVREITLKKNHSWNGMKISELDISRQTFIILVDRNDKMLIPYGDLALQEGDKILVYAKERIDKYIDKYLEESAQ